MFGNFLTSANSEIKKTFISYTRLNINILHRVLINLNKELKMLKIKFYRFSIFIFFIFVQLFLFHTVYAKSFFGPLDSTLIIFTKSEQTLGNNTTFGLAIADVDLDGDSDICIANYNSDATRLWMNDGNGNFTTHSQNFNVPYAAHDVALADLNGDLYHDIFFANHKRIHSLSNAI